MAFLPLTRVRTRAWGLPVRLLSFLESPDTPFVDIPMAREPAEVVPAFLRALSQDGGWDVLSLRKLPLKSATLKALRTEPARRLSVAGRGARGIALHRDLGHVGGLPSAAKPAVPKDVPKHREPAGEERDRIRRGALRGRPGRSTFAEVMDVSLQSWRAPAGWRW